MYVLVFLALFIPEDGDLYTRFQVHPAKFDTIEACERLADQILERSAQSAHEHGVTLPHVSATCHAVQESSVSQMPLYRDQRQDS